MAYGLVHTAVIFVALVLFFRSIELDDANATTTLVFVLLGSFSFVGIGMIAAILPLLYVERARR
jgi:ABC-2 type transport system permease protein